MSYRTRNDPALSDAISKILRLENDISRSHRDNELLELWKYMETVHEQSRLAMYRILDLRSGV